MNSSSPITGKKLEELEERLEKIRVAFEKYFLGVEKKPPTQDLQLLAREIRILAESFIPNTALRFRAQNLKSRLITYEQYWTRVMKEIEEGTYRRFRKGVSPPPQTPLPSTGTPLEKEKEEDEIEFVVSAYRKAFEQKGATPPSVDQVRAVLLKQREELKKKYPGKKVLFRLEEEGGKPKIKAILKKEG